LPNKLKIPAKTKKMAKKIIKFLIKFFILYSPPWRGGRAARTGWVVRGEH
jgi:hypothetical protein